MFAFFSLPPQIGPTLPVDYTKFEVIHSDSKLAPRTRYILLSGSVPTYLCQLFYFIFYAIPFSVHTIVVVLDLTEWHPCCYFCSQKRFSRNRFYRQPYGSQESSLVPHDATLLSCRGFSGLQSGTLSTYITEIQPDTPSPFKDHLSVYIS